MSAPVAEPLSWQVVQWVLSRLQLCIREDGWHSDIGSYEPISDRSQVPDSEAYLLCLAQDFSSVDGGNGRAISTDEMTLLIEFGIPRDPALSPELAAHRARADVRRAFRKLRPADDAAAPKGLHSLDITAASIGDAPDGANLIVAQCTARAVLGDSYTPAT